MVVIVTRKDNKNVVMISEEFYNNLMENVYVMGNKANYDWLMRGKAQLENGINDNDRKEETMKKTIITVVGKDTVGIIARVCTYLADNQINILDISQTIVQGFFNMMMIVDTNLTTKDFGVIVDELEKLGEEIGVVIKCQKEEIFDQMHRI